MVAGGPGGGGPAVAIINTTDVNKASLCSLSAITPQHKVSVSIYHVT